MTGQAAILGGGQRGADWAARFVLSGWDVALFDPDPEAAARVAAVIAAARTGVPAGRLDVVPRISAAVAGAAWIGECVPDRVDLKRKLYQQVQAHCDPRAILAAATNRFAARTLQACATRPGQILVAHCPTPMAPAAPVFLSSGKQDEAARLARAMRILCGLGLCPVVDPAAVDGPALPPGA